MNTKTGDLKFFWDLNELPPASPPQEEAIDAVEKCFSPQETEADAVVNTDGDGGCKECFSPVEETEVQAAAEIDGTNGCEECSSPQETDADAVVNTENGVREECFLPPEDTEEVGAEGHTDEIGGSEECFSPHEETEVEAAEKRDVNSRGEECFSPEETEAEAVVNTAADGCCEECFSPPKDTEVVESEAHMDEKCGTEESFSPLQEEEVEATAHTDVNDGCEGDVSSDEQDATSEPNAEEAQLTNGVAIPDWVLALKPVIVLQTNRGSRIRDCIHDALNKNPPNWAKERLLNSISKKVYRSNASGPTKRAVISILEEVSGRENLEQNSVVQEVSTSAERTDNKRKRDSSSEERVLRRRH